MEAGSSLSESGDPGAGTTHSPSPSFSGPDGHSSPAGQAGRTFGVPRAQHSAIPNPLSKDTHFTDEEAEAQGVEPGMAGPRPGELDSEGSPHTSLLGSSLLLEGEQEAPVPAPGCWAVSSLGACGPGPSCASPANSGPPTSSPLSSTLSLILSSTAYSQCPCPGPSSPCPDVTTASCLVSCGLTS